MLLGDLIEKITNFLGLQKLMSDNCGCGKRKKKLNRVDMRFREWIYSKMWK